MIQAKGVGMIGFLIVELAEEDRGGEGVIGRPEIMVKDGGVRLKLKATKKKWVGRLIGESAKS